MSSSRRPEPLDLFFHSFSSIHDPSIRLRRGLQTAYERMLKSDVKYRFVVDMASLER